MNTFKNTTLFATLTFVIICCCELRAQSIERQLQKQIPTIVEHLRQAGHRNVGVLKFHVKKPDTDLSYQVGSLNSLMADRLEIGLIIGNPFGPNQLNIIRDASAQADKLTGADHATAAGRLVLFQHDYKPAWGTKSIKADAFLSGIVRVHDDGNRATIAITCSDANADKAVMVGDAFEADLDASHLGELGESFVLRGAFDGGTAKLTRESDEVRLTALNAANSVRKEQSSFPLNDPQAPVKLTIKYNGVAHPVEVRDGRAFVRSPSEGEKVEFVLTRQSFVQGRVGVVLKVNGENTLYRQTTSDLSCSKWILSPSHPETVVGGYQMTGGKRQDFKVLSDSESAARKMDYGRHTGQIQMTVFAEAQEVQRTAPESLDEEVSNFEEDLLAMVRGTQPLKTPSNLGQLKNELRGSKLRTRGLIVDGKDSDNEVTTVSYKAAPTPIMSVTITYYE